MAPKRHDSTRSFIHRVPESALHVSRRAHRQRLLAATARKIDIQGRTGNSPKRGFCISCRRAQIPKELESLRNELALPKVKRNIRAATPSVDICSKRRKLQLNQNDISAVRLCSGKAKARESADLVQYALMREQYPPLNLHLHTLQQQDAKPRKIIRLGVLDNQRYIMEMPKALIDSGATRCFVAQSLAKKMEWQPADLDQTERMALMLGPAETATGQEMTFLGMHIMQAIVPGTGQRFLFEAHVSLDEEMREAPLIIGDDVAEAHSLYAYAETMLS